MKQDRRTEEEKEILKSLELIDDQELYGELDREEEEISSRKEGGSVRKREASGGKKEDPFREKEGSSGKKRSAVGKWNAYGPYILTALGCVAVILAIVYAGLLLGKNGEGENQKGDAGSDSAPVTYTQEEVDALVAAAVEKGKGEEADRILGEIREKLESGQEFAYVLRSYYPDDLVVTTNGGIHFFPILEELAKNDYLQENLTVLENGEYQYVVDGQVVSHKGIDVSQHQGEIDWQQVAQDGVEFAILRVGFRGYGSEGRLVLDEQFENNVKGALSNGIKVGVYFFSQAISAEEGLEEAKLVLEQIAPYRITGPVVCDVERQSSSDSRTKNATKEQRTAAAVAFCQAVEEAGYRPMVYFNLSGAVSLLDLPQVEKYDKWFAHYTREMYFPYEYKIWQYSQTGKVQGINGDVDLDIGFEEWE